MTRRAYPRVAAAAVAAALPLSIISIIGAAPAFGGEAQPVTAQASGEKSAVPTSQYSGTAQINGPFPTRAEAEADGYIDEAKAGWRDYVYQAEDGANAEKGTSWSAGERYTRMEELKVTSQAMGGREIPVVTIKAKNNPETAPTIYLLNGADGGEGGANWLRQTSAVDFYGNRIGNVNVVIPMAGAFSYYTDWQSPAASLDTDAHGVGTTQKWETFLTQELLRPMEDHLGTSSGKRAIIGMSMTGSTSLIYAEKYPGFYDAVGSYSGCAATSREASQITQLILDRGNASFEQMWGDPYGRVAYGNDALLNAEKLADQHNIYVSSATGLLGEHDMSSGDVLNGNVFGMRIPLTDGFAIEAGSNICTHLLKSTTDDLGITEASNNLVYNIRNAGTHQWGYWQDDMWESWPVIARGLGFDVTEAQRQSTDAQAAHLEANPGMGAEGSTPVSSLLPAFDAVEQGSADMADIRKLD
ncbi:alpha/beta hydrolase family protein [Corynebacterium glyciniphilum]|uniref:alpha/beta hydrolase n=1 Tax=Corynebacterium glyciniphilum TaxID=1404244 RepID=UPI00264B9B7D|nr:alpha/beta hydrolase family protein [Corynebacterium glyciniphilum]MDN5684590.1 esterase family protein [Corynebacterium glyciniphilum]